MKTFKVLACLSSIAASGCAHVSSRSSLLDDSLGKFKVSAGRYPTTDEGLYILLVPPPAMLSWRGPYATALTIRDPWDTVFRYEAIGTSYRLTSAGPDGEFGNSDDIRLPIYGSSSSSSSEDSSRTSSNRSR